MEIGCGKCDSKFNIPDDKVPKDRVAYLKCPKCKNRIAVGGTPEKREKEDDSPVSGTLDDLTAETYEAEDRPFDFVEEEAKTSIVCVKEVELQKHIGAILEEIEYRNVCAGDAREALKKMRYHTFDLVVLEELFDCRNINSNGVLIFLQHLPMVVRRHIFTAIISEESRTMDNMDAFHKSVNLVVHRKELNEFRKILLKGIADHEIFYRVFSTASKKIVGL